MRSTPRSGNPAAARALVVRLAVFTAGCLSLLWLGACRDPDTLEADPPARPAPASIETPPTALVASWPRDGTVDFTRSEWIQIEFAAPPGLALAESFSLQCGGRAVEFSVHEVRPTFYVLNPAGELPGAARCAVRWTEAGVPRSLAFTTAGRGARAEIEYDRRRAGLSPPLPDDHFLDGAPDRPNRLRFAFETFGGERPLHAFAAMLERDLEPLDGWSPHTPIQIPLSAPADPVSLPDSAADSIHPAAALQLIDVDPRSPGFANRVAYQVEQREDPAPATSPRSSLLVHPLQPLRPGGQYAVLVTRSLRTSPGRPFEPSPFTVQLLAEPRENEPPALRAARVRTRTTLWLAENRLVPPIPREDLALVLRFTVGTLDGVGRDLAHVRRQLGVRPVARFEVERIETMEDREDVLEAIVHGTWFGPRWTRGSHFVRDAAGRPVIEGTAPIPFTLALPRDRPLEGAPLLIYQHGNPGSASREVPAEARRGLAEAGFAVIGFTDVFNRARTRGSNDADLAILMQWVKDFASLRAEGRLPERWLQTHAEQLAFLHFVQGLGEVDLLPSDSPDGIPEIDGAAPLNYLGMSEGANHAPAFLAFAPEVAGAVLVAGGAPIAGALTHQLEGSPGQSFARRALGGHGRDLWSALVLLQAAIDPQDPLNHVPLLYREPIEIEGTTRKASLLLMAGLYDRRIPNRMTDALAWAIGPLPLLAPVTRAVPFLRTRVGPIQGNLTPTATGAYHQIVPFGIVGAIGRADCRPRDFGLWVSRSGHYCAQLAPSAVSERVAFLRSTLDGAPPTIGRVRRAEDSGRE